MKGLKKMKPIVLVLDRDPKDVPSTQGLQVVAMYPTAVYRRASSTDLERLIRVWCPVAMIYPDGTTQFLNTEASDRIFLIVECLAVEPYALPFEPRVVQGSSVGEVATFLEQEMRLTHGKPIRDCGFPSLQVEGGDPTELHAFPIDAIIRLLEGIEEGKMAFLRWRGGTIYWQVRPM